jgi:asparagine synthase (glutamine-hydrolysing)
MYAFALWDDEKKELWLARDPFGIKPLYYAQAGSQIWFASQARALARCAPVNTDQSAAGLVGFYLWGAVPDPFTWWQGVKALPAGQLLRIQYGKAVAGPQAFLDVGDYYRAAPAEPLSLKALHDAFVESLAAHFVADVPVGIFLSAGIDSTAIATVAKELGFSLKTVTIAFDEFRDAHDDEAPYAEETALRLGADHRTVHIGRDEFYSVLDDFLETMDQPSIDGLNTYLVSRAAASTGLKVALSGLGGDELLGGYPSFKQVPALAAIGSRIPGNGFLGGLLQSVGLPISRLLNVTPKLAASLKYANSIERAYYLRRCLYLPEELDLLVDETWSQRGLEELSGELPGGDAGRAKKRNLISSHAAVSQLEVGQYMNMQLLRTTDWASMAHSLEVRVPFVDLRLFSKLAPAINTVRPPSKFDFAASIGETVMNVANRPKTGFTTPLPQWLAEKSPGASGLRPWADIVVKTFAA